MKIARRLFKCPLTDNYIPKSSHHKTLIITLIFSLFLYLLTYGILSLLGRAGEGLDPIIHSSLKSNPFAMAIFYIKVLLLVYTMSPFHFALLPLLFHWESNASKPLFTATKGIVLGFILSSFSYFLAQIVLQVFKSSPHFFRVFVMPGLDSLLFIFYRHWVIYHDERFFPDARMFLLFPINVIIIRIQQRLNGWVLVFSVEITKIDFTRDVSYLQKLCQSVLMFGLGSIIFLTTYSFLYFVNAWVSKRVKTMREKGKGLHYSG